MKHTVEEISLKNGAKGLVVHAPDSQVVNIEINFRAGEFMVEPEKWEVPHLLEHILTGANQLYPKSKLFQEELEKNGAYTNASTGVYDIIYEAECADFEWQRIMELLLIGVSKPLFLDKEFRSEYGAVREELTIRANNHFRELSLNMRKSTGYQAKTDKERLKLMKNVSLEDVRSHWRRTHTTNNLRFVIGGNFTPTRLRQLQDIVGGVELPKGRRYALPNERPRKLTEPVIIRNRTVKNLYLYIDTFSKRRFDDQEQHALKLANAMLTGTLYSMVLGTAREKGLIYYMNSDTNIFKNSTNWWLGTQITHDNAPALIDIIVSKIRKLLDGNISDSRIEATKQYALGRFLLNEQMLGDIVSGYSSRYFFDEIIDDYSLVPKQIKNVTKTAVTDAMNEIFNQNLWAMGTLGSAPKELINQLHQQLSDLWR